MLLPAPQHTAAGVRAHSVFALDSCTQNAFHVSIRHLRAEVWWCCCPTFTVTPLEVLELTAVLTSAAQGPTAAGGKADLQDSYRTSCFHPRALHQKWVRGLHRSKDVAHHISSHECWSYTSDFRAVEEFQACFPVLTMPYVLSPGFLTFLYVDWEAQNCIPAGTVQQALHSGGENSLSLSSTQEES